ncbi:MAG: nucleotidyl transferase AbiEii/AbiGii toxin family protein [Myxococcaceae bacterium]
MAYSVVKKVALFQEGVHVVFKGGTSLSKAYGILRRFSEDIDLSVLKEGKTTSQIERFIKQIAKEATQTPFEEIAEEGITSTLFTNIPD